MSTISFKTPEKAPCELSLADVAVGQFFVNRYGNLCLRLDRGNTYVIVAFKNGGNLSGAVCDDDGPIKRILTDVTNIEF